MTEKKLLSVCMITKNDESVIRDSLQKAKEIADEIILADIGSDDRTIEIAKREGATVYSIKWDSNYGEVKNFCLDHANGRWVLFLQANEVLAAERKEILPLLDNPNVEGYLLFVDYCSEEFRIASPVQSLRLLRNHRENRFRYRSFECLPDESMANLKDAKIQIKYRVDAMQSWELDSRITLLREEAGQYPADGYLQYLAGIILLNRNQWEEGIECLEAARKNCNPGLLFAPHLYKCLSFAYLYLEQYDGAMEVLQEGVSLFSFYSDLLVLRAELYNQKKCYDEAIRDLESCLAIREHPNLTVPEPEIDNAVVFETLGEVYEKKFHFRRALACYRQALELSIEDIDLVEKIVELAHKTKSCDVLQELLEKAVQEGNDYLAALTDALLAQREYVFLLDNWDCIGSVLGGDDNTKRIRSVCRMMLGELQDEFLERESPLYFDELQQRIEICWVRDEWMQAKELLQEMENRLGAGIQGVSFYRFIHGLLTGAEYVHKILTPQEYELAAVLHDDFLWLGKENAALILLPHLLHEAEDDSCIRLVQPWAERGNLPVIESIFSCVAGPDKRADFIQKAIEILLRYDHLNAAHKLADMGGPLIPEELEAVLWARCLTHALQEWMAKAKDAAAGADRTPCCSPAPVPQDTQLNVFYNILCTMNRKADENRSTDCSAEPAAAEIHEKTGDIYLESGQTAEAFSAYCKGLQRDPQNEILLENILSLFCHDPGAASAFLAKKEWKLEGGWFAQKQALVDFVYGLKLFYSGRFDGAATAFSRITRKNEAYPLSRAYIAAGLLIGEREEEIGKDVDACMTAMVCRICKHYVLYKLGKINLQYHYCELILLERERTMELPEMI